LNWKYPLAVSVKHSTIILDGEGQLMHAFLTDDDKWRMRTDLSEISEPLRKAILFKEDKYFYQHVGVNPIAVFRALFKNLTKQKRTSGASTITMQVARLLYPVPRTYKNKGIEMFRALQLEWHYSKDEILQLYLNLIPYGSNIEGIKSASVLYFDKSPEQLSLAEIACLSIIPNRPTSLLLGKRNELILQERNKWLNRYLKGNLFEAQIIEDALKEPLDAYRHNAPKLLPHLAYRLKTDFSQKPIIRTNINLLQQKTIEQIVRQYVAKLSGQQIQNAAVMVLDNETMDVVAYIGSHDFTDGKNAGQVDGIRAVRSPGSTLKPMVYAMAFDKGICTPKQHLPDIPFTFDGYNPVNFDGKYNGSITAEYALAQSLNIPAVGLLEKMKHESLTTQLSKMGFRQIKKDAGKLGLSMALGGCGVRLEELVAMYASFANKGMYRAANFIDYKNKSKNGERVITEASAYMLSDILLKVERPDLPNNLATHTSLPNIAWKTGTSYGRKDAWSVGYNSRYTIGVWVGNFSGQGVPHLTGSTIAAPLLFDVFNYMDRSSNSQWNVAPETIDLRYVCSETGLPQNTFCDHSSMDVFIPLISATQKCQHLSSHWVNMDTTESYCSRCLPDSAYQSILFDNPPANLLAYAQHINLPLNVPPPHASNCGRVASDDVPKIVSLSDGLQYLLDSQDDQQLMFKCETAVGVEQVSWFVNDVFIANGSPEDPIFYKPSKGSLKISCADDKGRHSDIKIRVAFF